MKPILTFAVLLGTMVGQTTKPAEPLITLTGTVGDGQNDYAIELPPKYQMHPGACFKVTNKPEAAVFTMVPIQCPEPADVRETWTATLPMPSAPTEIPTCGTKEAVEQPACAVGEPNIYLPTDVLAMRQRVKVIAEYDSICEKPTGCSQLEASHKPRYKTVTKWTCADKTRILLHDGETPPRYWCHRPETDKR